MSGDAGSDDSLSTGTSELAAAAPSGLVQIATTGDTGSATIWPYTGTDFSGTTSDPINLVFLGKADPRNIRSALFALNGNRTAFGMPNAFPYNCTWADAMGANQTGYESGRGWVGSAIQLECGPYEQLRFHLRLFRGAKNVTLANAHIDVLIPGTTQHQVLSWEKAEQLVMVDLIRSGLLAAPPSQTGPINPAPSFRTIPAVIYNGLPVPVRALTGEAAPYSNVSADVGIETNGSATVLNLGNTAVVQRGAGRTRNITIPFDQAVPRPFCNAGPLDYVYAKSLPGTAITLVQSVSVNGSKDDYHSFWTAAGPLSVTPINPLTGQPTGATQFANVFESHEGWVKGENSSVHSERLQTASATLGGPVVTSLTEALDISYSGTTSYTKSEQCQ